MSNQLTLDNFEAAKAVAESKGKKLAVISNALSGEFLGYRLTCNHVRCHYERTVGIGKIRKILGMGGWKYLGGRAVAI